MKKILSAILLILLVSPIFSQRFITLKNDSVSIENRNFYIKNIIDKRNNKKFIGEIWKGTFTKTEKIDISGGTEKAVGDYLVSNFSKTSENQIATDVHINYLIVKQSESYSQETGEAYILLEFRSKNSRPFIAKAEIKEETDDAFSTHEERIRRGFKECVVQFNNSVDINTYSELETDDNNSMEIKFNEEKEVKTERYDERSQNTDRNITTIGYQIGGYNLIGIDYEVRLHDYIGVHFGGGFLGYTAGVKIHTNERTNSLFFNLSWKDGGLGQINGVGLEAGGRWIWFKSRDFGLLYQGGVFVVNHMSDAFKTAVYGTAAVPPVMLSLGVGLSW